MERYKKPIQDNKELFNYIFDNAMGNIIVLNSAPTTASDMKGNTIGYYDGTIYFKLADNTFKKFDVSDV